MKKHCYLLFVLLFGLIGSAAAQAMDPQQKYTAFDMRHNGKIYVVVTVVLIILIGLLLYVARIDRRITRMEKNSSR